MNRCLAPGAPLSLRRFPTGSAGGARIREAGFTLLEVLVALAILGLAVVTLIELSSQSLRLVKTSGDYQQAVLIADRIARETQPTDEGVETGQDGSFQWERRIALVPMPDEFQPKQSIPGLEPPKLFAVTIDVRWGQNQSIELATLHTPTSAPPVPGGRASQPTIGTIGQPIAPGMRQPPSPSPMVTR
jgi:general secretion pathway protein I